MDTLAKKQLNFVKVFQEKQSQQAQAKLCEPLGLARTAWLESLAGVFASDGARNLDSLWLAYSPEAVLP